MNPQENVVPESHFDSQKIAPATMSATQPMYWSVRREIWENQSIYIAPLAVAGIILFSFLVSVIKIPANRHAGVVITPAQEYMAIEVACFVAAFLLALTAFIVGAFYCLDALHGERRDRSILFWKSLPVSDLTTVLSKASIPLIVLPLLTFAIILVTQLFILLIGTIGLLMKGDSAAALWAGLPLFSMPLEQLLALVAIVLWHAPIYGWLLLVSSWARRTPLLWAVLPLLAISIFEKIALHTGHFAYLVRYRVTGVFTRAFFSQPPGRPMGASLIQVDLGKFLSTPDLWIGLAVAAAFFAAAIRLRRYREPL
jgi:ABC-2 type transport system permease protein